MFLKRKQAPKRELALGLDLGTSQIKAALVRKNGDKLELLESAVRALPAEATKSFKEPAFVTELQQLVDSLKTPERRALVTLSCSSAVVCHAEFPAMPLAEIKTALKLNSTRYLRRDFSDYYLDAAELKHASESAKSKTAKHLVLVGGALRTDVDACRESLTAARIKPEVIELAAVSIINAFQLTHPELATEVVVLVDIGGRSTTINFLQLGLPVMTRIMQFGGCQVSEFLGQMLGIEPAQAEAAKLKMDAAVHELVQTALAPLAREIRSSIDFFERQHDCHVQRAFACGGSAASETFVRLLGESAGVELEIWNPLQLLDTSSLNGQAEAVIAAGHSLAAAVGVAAARLT